MSFVRSVTMDKWKDIELEKMKVGGNRNAHEFFESQTDWNDHAPIQQKYNSKAAAIYRDKISTLAQGKSWDYKTAEKEIKGGGNFASSNTVTHSRSSSSIPSNYNMYSASNNSGGSYQNGSGDCNLSYQNLNSQEFKDQKEEFFSKRQEENAARPE